jgi:hypothetical protein
LDQGSFDLYKQVRPLDEAEKKGEIDQGEQAASKKPPARSFIRRHMVIIIAASCSLLFLMGVVPMAILPPLEKVDLDVAIKYSGSPSGNTLYVDTDDIEIRVRNDGRETAYGDKISMSISGDNVVSKDVPWTGGDIPSGETVWLPAPIELKDPSKPFTLRVYIKYDGKAEAHDIAPTLIS